MKNIHIKWWWVWLPVVVPLPCVFWLFSRFIDAPSAFVLTAFVLIMGIGIGAIVLMLSDALVRLPPGSVFSAPAPSFWDHEGDSVLQKGSPEADRVSTELAILRFCTEVLKTRVETDAHSAWIWKTKLKVASLMATALQHRINWEPPSLLETEKEDVLADHPLLQADDTPPPDPSGRYANEQWFKDIRAKVEKYAASVRSD